MPYIHITVAGPALTPDQKSELHLGTTRLMADVLGKRAAVTAVRIEEVSASDWSVGGQAAPGRRAHLDVKITEGTNSVAERASLVRRAHALLDRVIGTVPEASYVVIDEVPAQNWGYAGVTQLERAKMAALPTRALVGV